ncbi:hypothetical protein GOP47_0005687 [Adiantum capillus-veneris]|uniref:BTB domain-containing protein n=1 Tax=Adiantum capillus-veneris TaxID=13818 RepID=A0A9D4V6S0_ADICA|nr:hypothetical protein GOP47_0005687 [Adiantum capillus-veneris]
MAAAWQSALWTDRSNAMQGRGEKRSRGAQPCCYGEEAGREAPSTIRTRGGSSKTAEEAKKRKTTAAMINNPACSDIQFITQDGNKVWANKAILAKASPLFSAMLTNGVTLDSTSPSVPLPSIPSAALFPVLEFLYTGSSSLSLFPLSVSSAPLVLHAARFLLLPDLEQSVSSFLANSLHSRLSQNSITPSDAPSYLSQALDMSVPHTHGVLSKLTSLIPAAFLLDPNTIAGFSQEALSFFLEKTRNGSLQFDGGEYPRLRCVLLWCAAISMASSELTELLSNYLPLSEELALASKYQCALLKNLKHFRDDLKSALEPWLSHLDLFRIHPDALTETFVPLDIIPHAYLMHVFAFQCHFSKDMIYLRWKSQAAADSNMPMQISVLDDGHSIKCRLKGDDMARSFTRVRTPGSMTSRLSMPPRFARAELLITPAMRSYEWDFVIEKESSFMAVGFCSEQALAMENSSTIWLGYEPFGWVLYHTGELFHDNKLGSPYGTKFGVGSRVRVHVDMVYFTCRFTVNDKAYGIAWKDIPHRIYPAAALTFPGKIRIEAARNEREKRLLTCLSESLPST